MLTFFDILYKKGPDDHETKKLKECQIYICMIYISEEATDDEHIYISIRPAAILQ